MKISFVTTIYWTANDVKPFVARCLEAAAELNLECEIILVNDGSPDDGLEVAKSLLEKEPRVVLVDLSRNFGQHKALWTGMSIATGDFVMILDGDLEEDPNWMLQFHAVLHENRSDVVYAVQQKPKGNMFYRLCRDGFYKMLNIISDFEFPRDVCTARLMTRRYVEALLSHDERESFLVGLMHVTGFRQTPVTVHKATRSKTTYTFKKLLRLFLMAVTAFSITPLIGVFLSGIALSSAAFLYIIFLVARYFITGVGVPGWTSVMAAVMLFSGVLIFFNGIIAIYIGSIFLEVKRRPRVIISAIYRNETIAPESNTEPEIKTESR